MANDVSYFNLENDSTEYAFNDADAEVKIAQETARATAAEQANAAAISAETTRATAAEQANATAISNETTRAEGVEGSLADLTTTAKSNLVAAINEVDAGLDTLNSNTVIVEITPFSSLATGYTLKNGSKVYKQGNHVFGDLVVECSEALGTGQNNIGNLTYKPLGTINSYCGLSTNEWFISRIGYFYINPTTGSVTIRDSTSGATFIKIHLDYVTS